jgi:predicted nucleic acid-binding protein
MLCLLDTNVLLRTAQPNHPMYEDAADGVDALILRGDSPAIVPQVIVEFWTVCTRPVANNGLGLSPAQAEAEVVRVESIFKVLPENARIFKIWKELVVRYAVSGLAAHDARIVAAMLAHGVTHILTFNADDFRRFREITVVTPANIIS